MRRPALTFISAFSLLLPAIAVAQNPPVGPRFQVNTTTPGTQGKWMSCGYYERRGQDVAADAAGNFVVVWEAQPEDGYGYDRDIVAQRFDRFGFKRGPEFRVNAETADDHRTPVVAMDASGNFVVAWNSYPPYSAYYGDILAKRFTPGGLVKGTEFQVSQNSYLYSSGGYSYTLFHYYSIRNPDVAASSGGNFIVAWQREEDDPAYLGDGDARQIVARRYDSAGNSQGGIFKISEPTALPGYSYNYWNEMPHIAMDADEKFVVVWKAIGSGYPGEVILGRRFDSAGAPASGEFRIDTEMPGGPFESTPAVEMNASGGFVVVWGSSALDAESGDDTDVAAQRFDSAGSPVGGEFRVNTSTLGPQCGPAIAHLDSGGFVVTWHRASFAPNAIGYGQQLDEAGNFLGNEFLLDGGPSAYVNATAVAPQGDDFVVVWAAEEYDADESDVFAQRFGTTAAPSCSPAPLTTCLKPTIAGRGAFRFTARPTPSQNRLTLAWTRGEGFANADLGDPLTDTDYTLCVYDASANPQPLATLVAPGGLYCDTFPCWRVLTGSTQPLMYVDNFTSPHGIFQILLRPNDPGRSSVVVKGRGANLPLPATPLTAPVTVQLQGSHGTCWSAKYQQLIRLNADGKFRANPDL
jgi:hypothetical protein